MQAEKGKRVRLLGRKGISDLICDEFDVGKEPMIRVLGRNPMEVVDKVIRVAKAAAQRRG